MRNKIAGAIYGFAIGDAMGATTEFMTEQQIKQKFGKVTDIIGGGWLNLKAGEITDDTQMTMCVMNALMRTLGENDPLGYFFMTECRREFIKWYKSGPKDVGGQCSIAINYMMSGEMRARPDDRALGNGSLMRAMPCALLNNERLNELQGRMTHNNQECSQIIQNYSRLIQDYINGNLYTGDIRCLYEPSGFIVNTFNNSVYWSCRHSFENAIVGAVNHGGDADTIAAITGSLAGAKFGYDAIPERWITQLNPDVKMFLEKFKNFVFSCLQI
jgi:ADP-ribosyl-[dinitrogen reductase] hydrolase